MNLLLDTHAFLWHINGDEKMSVYARQLIADSNNQCYLSFASLWEMSIKSSLGKLTIPLPIEQLYREYVLANHIKLLEFNVKHLQIIHDLPFHHNDPFDRIIIAQAMVEHMPIIGCDSAFKAYNIQCLW